MDRETIWLDQHFRQLTTDMSPTHNQCMTDKLPVRQIYCSTVWVGQLLVNALANVLSGSDLLPFIQGSVKPLPLYLIPYELFEIALSVLKFRFYDTPGVNSKTSTPIIAKSAHAKDDAD